MVKVKLRNQKGDVFLHQFKDHDQVVWYCIRHGLTLVTYLRK